MSKEKRRVPKLRFPGFTEDWEQRKLESILIEYTEKNPENENLPVLTSSRQGLTKQEDHFGSVQRHDISDYNVIPLGFCTYRNRSGDKTFTFNINRIVPRGLVSKFYPVFEIKNGNADFITEYLNNNTEIIKSLAINAVGTSQVVLSLRTLRIIEITLPLKAEQVAIGNLMRKLDIYITLHQRKLEHLNLKKKALLQKLFPKNGERYPELRFPEFTDAWEQHKLSEVVTINPKTELPDEFKYVDLESVVGTNLLGFQVVKKENAPSRAQRLASYGDVFYQTVRPYQRNNYLFENVDKNMVFSTGYAQLRSKLDSYFLLTLVQNDNFVKMVLDNCTGTSYPAINGSALGNITVRIPSNEVEANQIGKVFRGIDKNITLHQRKLEHLQLQKKALLQQMFV